ncbi:MAG: TIGR00300 family protein [Chloroflexi bacterium]|nr:TIGR00300 family protein [Chloroflexota bacterium]
MNQEQKHVQVIELSGHIIDSMILPKILDELLDFGVEFKIQQLNVGRGKTDPSYAQIEIVADTASQLDAVLGEVQRYGATPLRTETACLEPAPADGVFPENFYSTTNMATRVRIDGEWLPVANTEMDCGILIEDGKARCIAINEVLKGQMIVVGHGGVRVVPTERPRVPSPMFSFMGSQVSSEKPKSVYLKEIAERIVKVRASGGKILVVGGPAIIHTGSGELLCRLIERGFVDYLFAGNALAVHDIESALMGTSLGISLDGGMALEGGHEHHLRAINRIRAAGGIRQAVETGILRKGVMYTCVKHGVDYVLAGSIRDDGPLPDVITDVIRAQVEMRKRIHEGVEVAIMLSTMLHSIAVGNLLPASVFTVCVDINQATLTKLVDRGSFQTAGLVMDVGGFLRELLDALEKAPAKASAGS